MHLYKKIPQIVTQSRPLLSKFVYVVQKRLRMNKFVRTNTGSKFSKTSLRLLWTEEILVMYLYFGFSMRGQMAPQQTAKFRIAFFVQFFTSLRKDSVVNYSSILTLFPPPVKRLDVVFPKH